jgi:medium-chain acyl-[acyl-carrier-protein] hydrolase
LRLFCFPHAGGRPAAFRAWLNHLPYEIELCAMQLPGRDGRRDHQPFSDLADLVPELVRNIHPHLGSRFAFFGHSLGAIVAFEVVRELRRRHDIEPVHLFAAARRAPHHPNDEAPVHRLPDHAFVEAVRRRWGGIPEEVLREPDLLALVLPILRADVTLVETYRYRSEAPLDCPISCIGGLGDPTVPREELCGWREHTRASFTVAMVPGDHFFPQSAPAGVVATVCDHLRPALRVHTEPVT